jgi:hypothetical protein
MTTATTAALHDEPLEPIIPDVWTRSQYRTRATVLLVLNVILFAGLGCFAFWLRTGRFFAPAMDDYVHLLAGTFMPKGDATLANFVRYPIDLGTIPVHGLVVGLLMAALVSIPILIAILYRFPYSLPFIAVVAFIAVMPWLAINLIGACLIATRKKFRFRFRYASAMLGLLLVLLYFYGASRQSAPLVESLKPEDRIKYVAPWVIATIASCLIMGTVLALARLVNYRPGVISPLLVLSFAVPVALFETYIGRHELYYRLLEREAQDQFHFLDSSGEVSLQSWFDELTQQRWEAEPEPRPSLAATREMMEFRLGLELEALAERRSAFVEQRDEWLTECDWFIRYFPDSRYAPNVLYLKARALDTRIDTTAFRDKKVLRFYDDFPAPQSMFTWRRVLANAPDADISAVARLRLATFSARAGQLLLATDLLEGVITKYDPAARAVEPEKQAGAAEQVKLLLSAKPADANLHIPVDKIVADARQLRDLLMANQADARYGLRPLCGSRPREPRQAGLLELDPHDVHYTVNLRGILKTWPDCLLADNIMLKLAMLAPSADERIAELEDCLQKYPTGDARTEGLFRLGAAYLDAGDSQRGRELLDKVVKDFPDDPIWTPLAGEQLRKSAVAATAEAHP